jgi:hypothetical protein
VIQSRRCFHPSAFDVEPRGMPGTSDNASPKKSLRERSTVMSTLPATDINNAVKPYAENFAFIQRERQRDAFHKFGFLRQFLPTFIIRHVCFLEEIK